jgi:hypothetical protein
LEVTLVGVDEAAAELALRSDAEAYVQRIVGMGADLRNVDPLAWWREAAPGLPCLAEFARRYLAVPATTAESERLFSLAGAIVSPMRVRLSPARVNDLVVTRAYYAKSKRPERGHPEQDTTDVGEVQSAMLDDDSVTVDEDGYVEAAQGAEVAPCWLQGEDDEQPNQVGEAGEEDGMNTESVDNAECTG